LGFDVLVTGDLIYTGSEIIRGGYVYIRGGRIIDVGEGPAPEDYTFATLVVGGPHRVVMPGLAVAADVAAYPVRFNKPGMKERLGFYKSVGLGDLVAAALYGVYELHMSGATMIFIESIDERLVDAVRREAGGFYGVAWPSCAGEPPRSELPLVPIASDECGQGNGEEVLFLESRPTYSLIGLGREAWERSLNLRRKAGVPGGLLRAGERAEIVVYDARKPPLAFIELNPEEAPLAPFLGATAETVIAGDEILVDTGQHLNIVLKHFTDSLERLAGIARKASGQ
jgi:hypothetical protein